MHQHATASGNSPGGVPQEGRAIGILPGCLRRREPAPDIAFRQRPINRVTQRMQPDIRIRMSIKAKLMRHSDAAQDQGTPRHQAVHIKARAGARDHAGHHFSFHAGKVLGPGYLHITLAARDNGNRLPERFQQGRIIRHRPGAGRMRRAQSFKPKGLRGLGAE